jgi:hypothetical protein
LAAAFLTGFAFDLFALAARTAFIFAFMLALRSAADFAGAVLDWAALAGAAAFGAAFLAGAGGAGFAFTATAGFLAAAGAALALAGAGGIGLAYALTTFGAAYLFGGVI